MDGSNTKGKQFYVEIMKSISNDSMYTFASPKRQLFAFPPDVMIQICEQKQSQKVLIKLYQTCKYFYKKCQILPIDCNCECRKNQIIAYRGFPQQKFNFNKKVMFWFDAKTITIYETCHNVMARIYCSNIKELSIVSMILTLDEFKFLISKSSIEDFWFQSSSNITDSCGMTIPINAILELLPNSQIFSYHSKNEKYSKETLLALNQLQIAKKFSYFALYLHDCAENIHANLLWKFIQKNIDSDSYCSISTFYMEERKEETKLDLNNAFKNIFPNWNGKQPKIVIL